MYSGPIQTMTTKISANNELIPMAVTASESENN